MYIYISKTAIIVNKRMNPRTREKEKDRPSCFNSPGILQFPAARKNSGAERKEKEEKNGFRRVSWERSRREFRLSALKQRGTTTAKLNTDRGVGRRRPCKTRPWIDLERGGRRKDPCETCAARGVGC